MWVEENRDFFSFFFLLNCFQRTVILVRQLSDGRSRTLIVRQSINCHFGNALVVYKSCGYHQNVKYLMALKL